MRIKGNIENKEKEETEGKKRRKEKKEIENRKFKA